MLDSALKASVIVASALVANRISRAGSPRCGIGGLCRASCASRIPRWLFVPAWDIPWVEASRASVKGTRRHSWASANRRGLLRSSRTRFTLGRLRGQRSSRPGSSCRRCSRGRCGCGARRRQSASWCCSSDLGRLSRLASTGQRRLTSPRWRAAADASRASNTGCDVPFVCWPARPDAPGDMGISPARSCWYPPWSRRGRWNVSRWSSDTNSPTFSVATGLC